MKQIVKTIRPDNQIDINSAMLDYMKFGSRRIICQVYDDKVSILTKYHGGAEFPKDSYGFYEGGDGYNCVSGKAVVSVEKAVGSGVNVYFFDNWKEFAQAVIDNDWH